MIEEVVKNIYKIKVPMAGNPLKNVNVYYIKGDDREVLIDTGFRTQDCLDSLRNSLEELHYDPDKMDVIVTHFHADHSGLADIICPPRRHVYMTKGELEFELSFPDDTMFETVGTMFMKEGYPADQIEDKNKAEFVRAKYDREQFLPVTEDDLITVGEYNLKPIIVPGHTPANMMLYDADKKLMFTSDHVLFNVTPNISVFPGMEDSLGAYIDSLKRADTFDVELALPSHRDSGDYHERIKTLISHHYKRLDQTYNILKDHPGADAYTVASFMTWKIRCNSWDDFPLTQKYFAMAECIAHLRHLVATKRAKTWDDEQGIIRYSAI